MKSYELKEHENLTNIAINDITTAYNKDQEYGASWKKRGGPGAYLTMTRKMDRLEEMAKRKNWDIFEALRDKNSSESLIDTIRDLRVYLALIENEAMKMGIVPSKNDKTFLVENDGVFTIYHTNSMRDSVDNTGQKQPFGFNADDERLSPHQEGIN